MEDILYSYPKTPSQLYYYAIQAETRDSLINISNEIESNIKYKVVSNN
jgi:hypothetical protein